MLLFCYSLINADKAAHRARLIQRLFCARIRQIEPVLEEVNAQHPLQPCRRATISLLGIIGFNLLAEFLPRHHLIHLQVKVFPACGLAKRSESPAAKLCCFIEIRPLYTMRIYRRCNDLIELPLIILARQSLVVLQIIENITTSHQVGH